MAYWLFNTVNHGSVAMCSECGWYSDLQLGKKQCPKCGADMTVEPTLMCGEYTTEICDTKEEAMEKWNKDGRHNNGRV